MLRIRSYAVAAALVVGCPVTAALAQPQPPISVQRPTFSPYLNLLNRGGSPALNYFGIVRPQLQMQQQFGQLNQQLQQANANLQTLANASTYGVDPSRPVSGHAAVFNGTGHYFSSNPAYGGGFTRPVSALPVAGMGGNRPSIVGQAPRATGSTLRR